MLLHLFSANQKLNWLSLYKDLQDEAKRSRNFQKQNSYHPERDDNLKVPWRLMINVVPDTVTKWDLLAAMGMHWEQYQFVIKVSLKL